MTRPTHRPTSMFSNSADDLPLFSGTCQRAPASEYTPREQPQQDSMFDRREYIQKPVKKTTHITVGEWRKQYANSLVLGKDGHYYEPETNTEARQQATDADDDHFDHVLNRAAKLDPKDRTEYIDRSARSGYISNVEAAIITVRLGKKKAKK